jgi:peptidyl-prolyl cis-trans isomerase A (cyclophilin A)
VTTAPPPPPPPAAGPAPGRSRALAIVVGLVLARAVVGGGLWLLSRNSVAPSDQPSASPNVPTPGPTTAAGPAACGGQLPPTKVPRTYPSPPTAGVQETGHYSAVLVTSCGTIEIELFADRAPRTVDNFVALAKDGFYDGTIFHRVIAGFMIQGGDPQGTGFGGPGYEFEDEIDPAASFDSDGILAMANAGPDTNGSQFFITLAPATHLDGNHTIFGRVTVGLDVVHAIGLLPTGAADDPQPAVYVESVTIIES